MHRKFRPTAARSAYIYSVSKMVSSEFILSEQMRNWSIKWDQTTQMLDFGLANDIHLWRNNTHGDISAVILVLLQ